MVTLGHLFFVHTFSARYALFISSNAFIYYIIVYVYDMKYDICQPNYLHSQIFKYGHLLYLCFSFSDVFGWRVFDDPRRIIVAFCLFWNRIHTVSVCAFYWRTHQISVYNLHTFLSFISCMVSIQVCLCFCAGNLCFSGGCC